MHCKNEIPCKNNVCFSDVTMRSAPPAENIYNQLHAPSEISNECLRDRRHDISELEITNEHSTSYFTADESVQNTLTTSSCPSPSSNMPAANNILPSTSENKLSIILTNARSLSPKICSLIDLYKELDITAGIITESWFVNGPTLDKELQDLELGTALKTIYKNRTTKNKKNMQIQLS